MDNEDQADLNSLNPFTNKGLHNLEEESVEIVEIDGHKMIMYNFSRSPKSKEITISPYGLRPLHSKGGLAKLPQYKYNPTVIELNESELKELNRYMHNFENTL